MNCIKCGKELKEGASFCGDCGTKVEVASGDKVDLAIIRNKRTIGFAISFKVLVDDVEIGSLKNGGTLNCKVTRGKHKVVIKAVEKDTVQEIDVTATTNKVEVYTIAKMGLIAATCNIEEVKYL